MNPCPCGETPQSLTIIPSGTLKYAFTAGACCAEWYVEFRTQYKDIESSECYKLALEAWNEAPRKEP